jgi:hypothetical protein
MVQSGETCIMAEMKTIKEQLDHILKKLERVESSGVSNGVDGKSA